MEPSYALDAVVTSAAVALMAATAETAVQISERVLADLVAHFDVDVSFLRYNDHTLRASVLVAEWPPRPVIVDPDPLAVVYFADADPVFAQCEHATRPAVLRPQRETEDYQRLVESGTGVPASSTAAVPLLSGDITTGTLGFVKFGDRDWRREELNALQVIAALFAQVQARITAEDRLRYLAHHDELTGLCNRRGLLEHLSQRRRDGDPMAVLFLDVDRLKEVNDELGHAAGDDVIRVTARRLRETLAAEDVLARLGGDEFVACLVAPVRASDVAELTDRIHARLAEPLHVAGSTLIITASIGILLTGPGDDREPEQLLRDADTVMYAAKKDTDRRGAIQPPPPHHGTSIQSLIDQAIGIVRGRTGATTAEVFDQLEQMSLATSTDVGEVAHEIVEDAVRRARRTAGAP